VADRYDFKCNGIISTKLNYLGLDTGHVVPS